MMPLDLKSPPTRHHDDSVFTTLTHAAGPITFDEIVVRVQKQSAFSRNEIAAAIGRLITRQSVFLNQEKTGFVAVRPQREKQRYLERAERAVKTSARHAVARFA